jgi:hypothetical protein
MILSALVSAGVARVKQATWLVAGVFHRFALGTAVRFIASGSPVAADIEFSGRLPTKRLVGLQPSGGPVRIISSLTAPRGFVFSRFPYPQDVECTDFSDGAANGGRV